jgi:hypothetical protein
MFYIQVSFSALNPKMAFVSFKVACKESLSILMFSKSLLLYVINILSGYLEFLPIPYYSHCSFLAIMLSISTPLKLPKDFEQIYPSPL